MNRALFIGVYPGLDDRQIGHVSNVLHGFVRGFTTVKCTIEQLG